MKNLVFLLIKLHYILSLRGVKFKGLGFVQKLLRKEFVFPFQNLNFYFLPGVEGSYDYILIGKSNEPETQIFLSSILETGITANFVDVGASIGEFVMSLSRFSNVKKIFAIEPRSDCAVVLRENILLNNEKRILVIEKAASNKEGVVTFHLNPGGTSSGFYKSPGIENYSVEIPCSKLDNLIPESLENPILLIDVEGAEPFVLDGASNFIRTSFPLIIFEFNNTSKKHFSLEDIRKILGEDYQIYRLRRDGKLDANFIDTWNCVAVNKRSQFISLMQTLILD